MSLQSSSSEEDELNIRLSASSAKVNPCYRKNEIEKRIYWSLHKLKSRQTAFNVRKISLTTADIDLIFL